MVRHYWWLAGPPLLLAMSLKVGSSVEDPVRGLTGHYLSSVAGPGGERVDSVVEVVPIAARHAYIRADLRTPTGGICTLSGVADAVGPALIYRARRDGPTPKCRLTIRRQDRTLLYSDAGDACSARCRGDAMFDGTMAWSSRRRTDLAKPRATPEYRAAVERWNHP